MTGSPQAQFFEWLSTKGVRLDTVNWHIETGTRRGELAGIAHTDKACRSVRAPLERGTVTTGVAGAAARHVLCDACLPQALDDSLDADQATSLHRELLALRRTALLVEDAGSTFHVVIGREYPALHAAIVGDVEPHLRRELGKNVTHPIYEQARVAVSDELDTLVASRPYDAGAALEEAILLAARWRFARFRTQDLFERGLKEHSDPVSAIGERMLESVRRPGQARDVAETLVSQNAELAEKLPELGEILRNWADVLDGALRDTVPTYFASGGLPLGFTSVPRTAIRWMVWHGVRAHHHHWGIGELPKVLLEYVAHSCRTSEMHANVEIIETPYEPLSDEAWHTADALWKEHMNQRRDEVLYAHPGEAILAAARL